MTKQQIKEEARELVETKVAAGTKEYGEKFKKLLYQTLLKIWPHVKKMRDPKDHLDLIIFVDVASLFHPTATQMKGWTIFFPPWASGKCRGGKAEAEYTIAHEFAHYCLGHYSFRPDSDPKDEEKAHELVKSWGIKTSWEVLV